MIFPLKEYWPVCIEYLCHYASTTYCEWKGTFCHLNHFQFYCAFHGSYKHIVLPALGSSVTCMRQISIHFVSHNVRTCILSLNPVKGVYGHLDPLLVYCAFHCSHYYIALPALGSFATHLCQIGNMNISTCHHPMHAI